jgi:hypothetical protein
MNNRQGGLVGVQAIVVGVQTMCVLVRHAVFGADACFGRLVWARIKTGVLCACFKTSVRPTDHASV